MPVAEAFGVELGCAVDDRDTEVELSSECGGVLEPEVDGVTTTDDDDNDDVDEDIEEEGVWLWLLDE